MRMSAPGCCKSFFCPFICRRQHDGGFTLIELLVVLVILALIAGLITVNFSRDERRVLEREARSLVGALEYANDRARYRHELLGIAALPQGSGWQFLRLPEAENASWHAVDNDASLKTHALSQPLRFRVVSYAGRSISENAVIPIPPSGRYEPYRMELRAGEWRVNLAADPLGRIAVSRAEKADP